jgi:predicted membrane-bound dolichyl-phosphate-mannose-protein mannosyltransferase
VGCPIGSENAREQSTQPATPACPTMNRMFEIAGGILGLAVILAVSGRVCFRILKRSENSGKNIFRWLFSTMLVTGDFFFIRSLVKYLGGGMLADFAPHS